jgi:hypothetical protein
MENNLVVALPGAVSMEMTRAKSCSQKHIGKQVGRDGSSSRRREVARRRDVCDQLPRSSVSTLSIQQVPNPYYLCNNLKSRDSGTDEVADASQFSVHGAAVGAVTVSCKGQAGC